MRTVGKTAVFAALPLPLLLLFSFLLLQQPVQSDVDINKDRLYINIDSGIPCVRRFNATHQIGCGKLDETSYSGIVYAVRNVTELERLTLLNAAGNERSLVLVATPNMFESVINFYKQHSKQLSYQIKGIVLVQFSDATADSSNSGFSEDAASPNSAFSVYSPSSSSNNSSSSAPTQQQQQQQQTDAVNWNLPGGAFMFENFAIPMYVVTDRAESQKPYDDCYDKFNRRLFETLNNETGAAAAHFRVGAADQLCGMELGLEMSGAVSSAVCVRRSTIQHTLDTNSFCDPLGGSNYFAFLSNRPSNALPIVVLSARIDAFTLFEYYTPGANEPISGIVGLLALVELLAAQRDTITGANLLLVLFDNEAFDYGGSSRFANDLALNQFPGLDVNTNNGTSRFTLEKESIAAMIELGQLGSVGLSDTNKLYVHRDPLSYNANASVASLIDKLTAALQKNSNDSIMPVSDRRQQLPPSSLHAFLRQQFPVAGISLADHETAYKNSFYHSVFDTARSLNVSIPDTVTEAQAANYTTGLARSLQPMLSAVAVSVASLYGSGSPDALGGQQVDIVTLNRLVYCFYKNASCAFFQSVLTPSQWSYYLQLLDANMPKQQMSFYTGVNDNQISGKWISTMLLRYFARDRVAQQWNASECSSSSASAVAYARSAQVTLGNFNYVSGGVCVASAVYAVTSVSPAFAAYDDGVLVDTHRFAAWTESSWASKTVQMRLFMYTASAVSLTTVLSGVFALIVSAALTFWLNKYSNMWLPVSGNEQQDDLSVRAAHPTPTVLA